MKIQMLKNHGGQKKGAVIDHHDQAAREWIKAGVAKKVGKDDDKKKASR